MAPGTTWVVEAGDDDDIIKGSDGADRIYGRGGSDVINGRGGDDFIWGARGHNTLRGGSGNDRLRLNKLGDSDDVYAGRGNDVLEGTVLAGSRHVLDGGPGINELDIRALESQTRGFPENVRIDLTRGRLNADGAVTKFSGVFHTLLFDEIFGKSWTIYGTSGPDVLSVINPFNPHRTTPRPIIEHGRAGDDVLITGLGSDTLDGGSGVDQGYAGERGPDTCISIEAPLTGQPSTSCSTSTPRGRIQTEFLE